DARADRAALHHRRVAVVVVVSGPDIPGRPAFAVKVEGQFPGVRDLLDHIRRRDAFTSHGVVVHRQLVVLRRGLTVDQAARLYRGLARIGLALDDYPVILGPLWGLLLR